MRAMAAEEGAGYIVRTAEYEGRERHAKAGNLNNALFQTSGEFILILDADQVASPEVLTRTLGHFYEDPKVCLVQTPQFFYNVPPRDPFGSQAPLFYGPIQQGKDGWNAAFFCGSNAVLRREALMQLGVTHFVVELEQRLRRALKTADALLRRAARQLSASDSPAASVAVRELRDALRASRRSLRAKEPIQAITWRFQRQAEASARRLVGADLLQIRAELADIPGVDVADVEGSLSAMLDDEEALSKLAGRADSPLTAIEAIRGLLLAVDVDRESEAQPVMPMSTISVTEDMATAMRLHALGWKTVYHHEDLVQGLAPEDLRTALQQRLRWAQGTIQVMLRENPLVQRGLSIGQRLMYLGTMWTYLSGFFTLVYLAAPVLYLFFGWLPVRTYSADFFWHLVPFLVVNQLLFLVVGWGRPTWRGQQYSLALFPIWIKAVVSAAQNVWFGKKLGFVVTPKTRQGGIYLGLVRPQLIAMGVMIVAALYGLTRLALGRTDETVPILINVFWIGYNLVMLSVVVEAAVYRPSDTPEPSIADGELSEARGRVGAGM
jgi:cellulose synthase (UDP-forming)